MATQNTPAADVVVIGGGLAGLCAALAAAHDGAEVVLLEKQGKLGGSTVLSAGLFAFAGTDMQRKAGIADLPELLFKELREAGAYDNDEALLKAFVAGQLEFYQWMLAQGVTFHPTLDQSSGQSVARCHSANPPQVVARLAERIAATGKVRMLFNAHAAELIRDRTTDVVTGVMARVDGRDMTFAARGGVVIGTGGFSRSDDLIKIFAPAQMGALRFGGMGNTGDGLKMAWRLGAGFRDMGYVKATFGTHPDTGPDRHEMLLAFYAGAIIVNTLGRRFVDESMSYKVLGDACLKQPGNLAFQVFDQGIMERSEPGIPTRDFSVPIERGLMLQADTLDALAARCNIPVDAFRETVDRYNRDIASGIDTAFGRDGLCHHSGQMLPIARAPFYAYPTMSVVTTTYCGLTIRPDAGVLDVAGRPIEGCSPPARSPAAFMARPT